MIKAFVFDIGDCIEPSTKFEIENLEYLRRKYNLPKSFVKFYLQMDKYHELHMFHAQGEPKIMQKTLNKLKLNYNVKKLSEEMQASYWIKLKRYFTKEKLGREFIRVINFLRNNNYKTAVLSDNSFQAKRRYLNLWKKVGLKFDAFVVSAEVGVEKPSKKIFQTVLKRLKIKPKNAVYFGNNLKRDATAKNYGWDFVWIYGFMKNINPNQFNGKRMKFITIKTMKIYLKNLAPLG